MADIKINDISFDGNDLFADSENFLDDLSNDDMNLIQGGLVDLASAGWSTISNHCGGANFNNLYEG